MFIYLSYHFSVIELSSPPQLICLVVVGTSIFRGKRGRVNSMSVGDMPIGGSV